jgi:hypothetical protein
MANAVIMYEGPSLIDGAPIVVIATNLANKSDNTKTGDMVQTWIMRSDVAPHDAIHSGADASVCGDCPLRGTIANGRNVNRACYVSTWQAPRSVYDAYRRGIYNRATPQQIAELFAGRRIRLGAYGNPSAAPYSIWQTALAKAAAHTGYIHNWRTAPREWTRLVMASVETPADAAIAAALGYRTFRVRRAGEELAPKEIVCPASKEAGYKTTCALCKACGGTSSKARANVAILAHGAGARHA